MPIVGTTITKVEAEKKAKIQPNMKINSALNMSHVTEEEGPKGASVANFNFEFKVTYEEAGDILLKGYVSYIGKEEEIKEILKAGKDMNALDKELKTAVYNQALYTCSIKALLYSQDLNLPAHIQLPHIKQN